MLMKFRIIRKFDKTTFACKRFCFNFCYNNFFDFFIKTNLFDLFLFLLLLFEHTNLFDLSFLLYELQLFLYVFNKFFDRFRNVIISNLII